MEKLLFVIIAQLFSCVLARLDRSELGRHQVKNHGPRRQRLVMVDSFAKEQNAEEMKMMNWMTEESFTAVGDVQRAAMELSMSFSLSMSMSMSEPMVPTSPVAPSNPPIFDFQPPAGSIPSGPTGPTEPSAPSGSPFGIPPSGFPGPPNVLPPFPLPPAGSPGSLSPFALPPSGAPGPSGPSPPFGFPSSEAPFPPTPTLDVPTVLFPSPTSSNPIGASSAPPSLDPDVSDRVPGTAPTQEPSVSVMPTGETHCVNSNNLTLVAAADESSTPVSLDMSYSAESNSTSIEDFETELVQEFIRTAVFAIFGCFPDTSGKIAPNTVEIMDATCDPTLNFDNECFVMQTTFIIGVEGQVDTDVAAYEVYKAIQQNMEDGIYSEAVPDVVFLEFLSPQPLIPPPGRKSVDNTPDAIDGPPPEGDVDVSPWTIGFSVASVMGGFVSLLVWARSRRSRQNNLVEETTPWVNPDSETVI